MALRVQPGLLDRTFSDVARFPGKPSKLTGEAMLNPRYIVVNQETGWEIVQGGRRFPGTYPSKTQAICSAIALAESDGNAGCRAEVLVRHEDGRFITEWVFGRNAHADEPAPRIARNHST
jgi:hypothetical protein